MDMTAKQSTQNVPIVKSFFRYNASAMTASVFDFGITLFCKEILGIHYLVSVFLGALSGGIIAFTLGRNWTYLSKDEKPQTQGAKYLIIWVGSILLNTFGVYFIAEVLGFGEEHYIYWKVITATLVGAFYNFPMQRYFVFK